jgi:hypothetical protein
MKKTTKGRKLHKNMKSKKASKVVRKISKRSNKSELYRLLQKAVRKHKEVAKVASKPHVIALPADKGLQYFQRGAVNTGGLRTWTCPSKKKAARFSTKSLAEGIARLLGLDGVAKLVPA